MDEKGNGERKQKAKTRLEENLSQNYQRSCSLREEKRPSVQTVPNQVKRIRGEEGTIKNRKVKEEKTREIRYESSQATALRRKVQRSRGVLQKTELRNRKKPPF